MRKGPFIQHFSICIEPRYRGPLHMHVPASTMQCGNCWPRHVTNGHSSLILLMMNNGPSFSLVGGWLRHDWHQRGDGRVGCSAFGQAKLPHNQNPQLVMEAWGSEYHPADLRPPLDESTYSFGDLTCLFWEGASRPWEFVPEVWTKSQTWKDKNQTKQRDSTGLTKSKGEVRMHLPIATGVD